ncbi:MAG: hypothetical protein AAFX99_19010 [Myxococcota bacterium]
MKHKAQSARLLAASTWFCVLMTVVACAHMHGSEHRTEHPVRVDALLRQTDFVLLFKRPPTSTTPELLSPYHIPTSSLLPLAPNDSAGQDPTHSDASLSHRHEDTPIPVVVCHIPCGYSVVVAGPHLPEGLQLPCITGNQFHCTLAPVGHSPTHRDFEGSDEPVVQEQYYLIFFTANDDEHHTPVQGPHGIFPVVRVEREMYIFDHLYRPILDIDAQGAMVLGEPNWQHNTVPIIAQVGYTLDAFLDRVVHP